MRDNHQENGKTGFSDDSKNFPAIITKFRFFSFSGDYHPFQFSFFRRLSRPLDLSVCFMYFILLDELLLWFNQ